MNYLSTMAAETHFKKTQKEANKKKEIKEKAESQLSLKTSFSLISDTSFEWITDALSEFNNFEDKAGIIS
jgi:hypothetical protein